MINHFIIFKQLKYRSKQTFNTILGISIAVMTLITIMSLANGFENELGSKIMGFNPQITIEAFTDNSDMINYEVTSSRLADIEGVRSVAPFVLGEALVEKKGKMTGMRVYGINPSSFNSVVSVGSKIMEGRAEFESDRDIWVGKIFSELMEVKVGDTVTVSSLDNKDDFKVSGIFNTGLYDYDLNMAYIPLEAAQWLFDLEGMVTRIGIKVKDGENLNEVVNRIKSEVSGRVVTCEDQNRSFMLALKVEKVVMFLVVLFTLLIAGIGILNTLSLLAVSRKKEIGVFKAMGMNTLDIKHIFIGQSLIMGTIGFLSGSIMSSLVIYILRQFPITIPQDVYFISYVPFQVRIADIILVLVFTLLTCFFAAWFPASEAARIDPAIVLKNE